MGKSDYVNIDVKVNGHTRTIKMEKGCTFDAGNKRFSVKDNGKVSIFNKATNKTITSKNISMTNHQFATFKAVANNTDEGVGKWTLSIADIKNAIDKFKNGKLTKDLHEFLSNKYKVKNTKIFSDENKFSTYITSGKSKTSSVMAFQYAEKGEAPTATTSTTQTSRGETGAGLFSNPNIVTQKAFQYTVKSGEDIVSLATKYELDTYQIIAANPQLKEGKDYKLVYKDGKTYMTNCTLKPGQKITIPARYDVKSGSCKSIDDVAKITGYPKSYIQELLLPCEVGSSKIQKKYLTTYKDNHGLATIGFGHIGKVDGKPLSMKNKITISEAKAYEILAEDILKHEAMNVAYFGKKNWNKIPKSVRMALLDNTYNKGIWDGYMQKHPRCNNQRRVKQNLQDGHYLTALCNACKRSPSDPGILKRSVYRFIAGLKDLTPEQRKKAMKAYKPYYQQVLKKLKGTTRKNLKTAWENAEKYGKTSGFKI